MFCRVYINRAEPVFLLPTEPERAVDADAGTRQLIRYFRRGDRRGSGAGAAAPYDGFVVTPPLTPTHLRADRQLMHFL